MLNNLLESKPQKQKTIGSSIASTILHVGILVLAVNATLDAGKKEKAKVEKIDFVEVKKDEPPPKEEPKPPPPQEPMTAPPPKGFQVLTAPVNIPDVLPEIALTKKVTDVNDFTGKGVAGGRANGVVGGVAPLAATNDQPLMEFQVEKPVMAIAGVGNPRYPDILKSAGVEGEVIAQFVVDTLGRAVPGSFKVLKTTHELFASAVRNALPQMRFVPAEVGNHKVPQLVQQPFVFGIQK